MLEIVQVLCEKLRAASAIIEDNTLEMRGRAAKGLLRLAQQLGRTTKEGIRLDLMVSQSELGSYLSLSRANVSRQLGQLKDANVIKSLMRRSSLSMNGAFPKLLRPRRRTDAGWNSHRRHIVAQTALFLRH